ncbi:hypothetical protein Y032_0242g3431 [Ancylostoma ceylanicum]|uniref:Uncharacterized protein n=1 Tax=Ancylostoma ceylanicum TaxID=53326 RepID=A0A016SEM0_9BILA|nr:hypothetical protein Y032_0242g3431 [Ancylostoma ceylanicum]
MRNAPWAITTSSEREHPPRIPAVVNYLRCEWWHVVTRLEIAVGILEMIRVRLSILHRWTCVLALSSLLHRGPASWRFSQYLAKEDPSIGDPRSIDFLTIGAWWTHPHPVESYSGVSLPTAPRWTRTCRFHHCLAKADLHPVVSTTA